MFELHEGLYDRSTRKITDKLITMKKKKEFLNSLRFEIQQKNNNKSMVTLNS